MYKADGTRHCLFIFPHTLFICLRHNVIVDFYNGTTHTGIRHGLFIDLALSGSIVICNTITRGHEIHFSPDDTENKIYVGMNHFGTV